MTFLRPPGAEGPAEGGTPEVPNEEFLTIRGGDGLQKGSVGTFFLINSSCIEFALNGLMHSHPDFQAPLTMVHVSFKIPSTFRYR